MAEIIHGLPIQDRVPMRFYPTNGYEVSDDEVRTVGVFRLDEPGSAWLYNPWTGKMRDPRDIASDVYGMAIVPPDGCGDDHKAFSCRASILDLIHLVEKSTCRFMSEADGEYAEKAIRRIRVYLNMGVMPKQGEERLLEHPARVVNCIFGVGVPESNVIDAAKRAYTREESPAVNPSFMNFLLVQSSADGIRKRIDMALRDINNMLGVEGVYGMADEFTAVLDGTWPPEHIQELHRQEAEAEFAGGPK